ncbi:MAG: glycosyl transferase [Alloprevotella sp.]|nr:glycosyl transferase [Alloprevotella sp.]
MIQVYCPNLSERSDRKASITQEFLGKSNYLLNIIPAISHETGGIGLWQTFSMILKKEEVKHSPFFIFCEDDHIFTDHYSIYDLESAILQADSLGADVLLGGVSWMEHPIQISDHLFWLEKFNGMQFTVIFQRFYNLLLVKEEEYITPLDFKISELSDNIMVIYPFISKQREFGYSDVTRGNEVEGHVDSLFSKTSQRLDILAKVKREYKRRVQL